MIWGVVEWRVSFQNVCDCVSTVQQGACVGLSMEFICSANSIAFYMLKKVARSLVWDGHAGWHGVAWSVEPSAMQTLACPSAHTPLFVHQVAGLIRWPIILLVKL